MKQEQDDDAMKPKPKRVQRSRRAAVREKLAGKDLACWCGLDMPCHGDVLLEIANEEQAKGGAE